VEYAETIPFPATPVPRVWRGNLRVVCAAWGGVLAAAIPGIALDLPALLAVLIGVAVSGVILALPNARWRRADVAIELRDGELRITQGPRTRRIRASGIRRVSVLEPAGGIRQPVGYGPVFGKGLRWTFEVPDPSLGVVRIDRGRDGFDLDVATARPDALVEALAADLGR
jgi:hypothetical protein